MSRFLCFEVKMTDNLTVFLKWRVILREVDDVNSLVKIQIISQHWEMLFVKTPEEIDGHHQKDQKLNVSEKRAPPYVDQFTDFSM